MGCRGHAGRVRRKPFQRQHDCFLLACLASLLQFERPDLPPVFAAGTAHAFHTADSAPAPPLRFGRRGWVACLSPLCGHTCRPLYCLCSGPDSASGLRCDPPPWVCIVKAPGSLSTSWVLRRHQASPRASPLVWPFALCLELELFHAHTTPHHTTPHPTPPHHTTPHHTTPHHTTPHHTTPHHTTPHHTTPHHTTPHHTTPHHTTPHHTTPHHTPHHTTPHHTTPHHTTPHHTTPHHTTPHHTTPHHTTPRAGRFCRRFTP